MPLVLIVLAFLRAEVPPWHHAWLNEPRAHTELRYFEIAQDIATAAEEAPLDGDVAWTALLLAETAAAESALRADVDECRRSGPGGRVRAWGTFGLARPRREVCANRLAAARLAREIIRDGWAACAARPERERLAYYLSGSCDRGVREARRRWYRARGALAQNGISSSSGDVSSGSADQARGGGGFFGPSASNP